uniref:Tubulin polyglutamylase TTLL6 n=1 Tax=Lygus hesperus TaxID=30085 RepID=A0A0A9X8G8_LYGHE
MELMKLFHRFWLNFKLFWRRMRWIKLPYLVILVGGFFIALLAVNIHSLKCIKTEGVQIVNSVQGFNNCNSSSQQSLSFVAYGGRDVDSGHLRHVFDMFKWYGYQRVKKIDEEWDVMWSHDYPFQKLAPLMKNLKPHQKVNHFPGTGFITNKMDLATSGLKFIPKAFKIPEQKNQLLNYVSDNPTKKFVQKSNDHRGIKIKSLKEIDLDKPGSFIQEYISDPLLVDGYKFDIGVYTTITSFDPLRVYIYNGDALFRYCTEKYYPFDDERVDKYVIGDDYLPTWEVPSLTKYYVDYGFSMKESFDGYMMSIGRDPKTIWLQIEEAIRQVCLKKESQIMKYLSLYKSKRNFFEMMRFDFVVDNNLNVYIMEVNMSPNLSSAHFQQNQLLYEQVLYNLFSLVGLGTKGYLKDERVMVSGKNLVVSPSKCAKCYDCTAPDCQLCRPCLSIETERVLMDAYLEHMNRKDCKRVFPVHHADWTSFPYDHLGPENMLMLNWFKAKCESDQSWC